ncbi:MAG: ROK family transcriptional regulator [Clostridiales bacterium]|nr:ROK family transcriptional regulator [Clostridiales bacterium]
MMLKQNQAQLRAHNTSLVLETILRDQPISRADLARSTLLNKVTISDIVKELLDNNLIKEIGMGESSGGRRPTMLKQNEKAGFALAVNLAPGELTILATWLDGCPIERELSKTFPLDREKTIPMLIEAVTQMLDMLPAPVEQSPAVGKPRLMKVDDNPKDCVPLVGIGVAIHGNVFEDKILFTPHYDLANLNLCEDLREHFGVPVHLGNEANFSALGELGAGTVSDHSIIISIHSGIGAGLIRNGQLDVGSHGYAGEVGHTIVVPDGVPCPCGNQGCVEQYASNWAMRNLYRKLSRNPKATLRDLIIGFEANEPSAITCTIQFIQYLAILVNNLSQTLDPETIIINSRMTAAIPELIPSIISNQMSKLAVPAIIEASKLGDPAILYGGIFEVVRDFYGTKRITFPYFNVQNQANTLSINQDNEMIV